MWKAKKVETDLFLFLKYGTVPYLNKIEMRLLEICPAKNTFFLDKKYENILSTYIMSSTKYIIIRME